MAKKKFYAVAVGKNCGVFTDWTATEKQVKGFPAAKFKSFSTEKEAREWLSNPLYSRHKAHKKKTDDKRSLLHKTRSDEIVVYTDGGSINNPGPGGYGVVIVEDGEVRELSGGFRLTTNNRMEMMAAIVALAQLHNCHKPITLFSDSSYLVNGINKGWVHKWRTNGWKKADGKAVLNRDLWQKLLELFKTVDVTFVWVKGHAGNEGNERCDKLAVAVSGSSPQDVDVEYERKI